MSVFPKSLKINIFPPLSQRANVYGDIHIYSRLSVAPNHTRPMVCAVRVDNRKTGDGFSRRNATQAYFTALGAVRRFRDIGCAVVFYSDEYKRFAASEVDVTHQSNALSFRIVHAEFKVNGVVCRINFRFGYFCGVCGYVVTAGLAVIVKRVAKSTARG